MQRKLFTLEDVSRFDVADFTKELVTDLVEAVGRDDIRLSLDLHPLYVPAVKATPLALIVNELVGDAVRRGLSDGGDDIHVAVRRLNGHFLIRVEDTSTPVEVDEAVAEIGRILLETSCKQVDAKIDKRIEGHRTTVDVTLMVDSQENSH